VHPFFVGHCSWSWLVSDGSSAAAFVLMIVPGMLIYRCSWPTENCKLQTANGMTPWLCVSYQCNILHVGQESAVARGTSSSSGLSICHSPSPAGK